MKVFFMSDNKLRKLIRWLQLSVLSQIQFCRNNRGVDILKVSNVKNFIQLIIGTTYCNCST